MKNKKKIIILSLVVFVIVSGLCFWKAYENRDYITKDWWVEYLFNNNKQHFKKMFLWSAELHKVLEKVDSSTFKILGSFTWDYYEHFYYFKDKDNVYVTNQWWEWYTSKFSWADSSSFELLWDLYSKDKNDFYYFTDKISNVDSETFQVLEKWYAKDKNNVYYRGIKIEWTSWKDFKILSSYVGKDSGNFILSFTHYIKSDNKIFYVDYDKTYRDKFKWKYLEIENILK